MSEDNPRPEAVAEPSNPATWEDDETTATALLRATFALVAGGFLAYTQFHTSLVIHLHWDHWILASVISNFLLPLGIVWFFFGQGLVHQDWLKDQRHNAWNYGWNWSNWRSDLKLSAGLWAVMLPFIFLYSREASTRLIYSFYFPVIHGFPGLIWVLATLVLYMFCWEWFFRGFMLFGAGQGLGPVVAVVAQALIFGLSHSTKGSVEFFTAFPAGLILGTLCWRRKSFLPGFFTHALVQVSFAILLWL